MPAENTEEKGWKRIRKKLKNTYRLVIMNNESFEEVGSYKLTLLNVYAAICGAIVIVAGLVIVLIVFTPVKRFIPGYNDVGEYGELLELNQKLAEMEKQFAANETYLKSFSRKVNNDVETIDDAGQVEETDIDTLENVKRIREDELLRQEVEEEEQLLQREMLQSVNVSPREIPLEQLYFMPPITGVVSGGFMPDKKHFGVDILAPKNTPIKATMSGFVITSDWTLETGNTIGIQHSNNLVTFYKHNSALLKEVGNYVKAGEAVAIIGNTGTLSDGPHLHFELWHKGKPIDPAGFINFE